MSTSNIDTDTKLEEQAPVADYNGVAVAAGNDEDSPNDKADAQIEELTEEQRLERKRNCQKKAVIGVLLVAFIGYVIADSLTTQYIRNGVEAFLEWIEQNPVPGIFVFMVVYFVATVFFIPGSILTLGAGFVFANAFGLGVGVLLGTLSVFFGASAGAIAAFVIGRYLLRDWVSGLAQKYAIFQALDIAFEEKGFRIMALLRLSPVIPFNAINYVAGVTALGFWQYVFALIAILPGTVLYIFLGASAGSLADSANSGDNMTVTIVVIVVGVVFGVLAVGVTSYYAKAELNKIAEKRQAELDGEQQQEGQGQEGSATEGEKREGDEEAGR